MSISATLSSITWQDRKINLIDTPGEPSFVADALGALRVCEAAVFVVNAVMGVEVTTSRLWSRAAELDIARHAVREHARPRAGRLLPHARELKAAFGPHVVATEIPIGSEHETGGRDRPRRHEAPTARTPPSGAAASSEIPIPPRQAERAQEYREKLMDEVCEVSDSLMERYLEGEEISHEEIVGALKEGTNHGKIFPVVCGVRDPQPRHHPAARRDRRGPALAGQARRAAGRRDRADARRGQRAVRVRVQDPRRPVRGPDQPAARLPGGAARRQPGAQHPRPRQGADRPAAGVRRQGGRPRGGVRPRRHRRRGQAQGDPRRGLARRPRRADRDAPAEAARPGDGVRGGAEEPRRRGQGASRRCAACRRRTRRSTCTATRRPASRSSRASPRCTSK